ncbi:RsmB/NOP family class I SAM-dependent RNA methyltransferase [Corynebacterium caspium]|uniref:RsmB/NOP family class I SAM-dependent RNA methyltransferase n=1 Tax=Corynebacterium caspium TaxID=234828 RepID=UPI00036F9992|nr:transcription antitermination factor NusB [Corynebacterium caspium]WKD59225.1 Ribosomal RNA small subunit methyltransferase B [Corynebacterium caspium DSM 44850]
MNSGLNSNSGGGFRSRSRKNAGGSAGRTDSSAGRGGAGTTRNPRGGRAKSGTRYKGGSPIQRDWNFAGIDAPRRIAFETLQKVTEDDAFANLVLPKEISRARLDTRDAAFATELTYGTLRSMGQLDVIISKASTRELSQISPEVLNALRLGTYQILYLRVGQHAAVDTTVRLVEATGNIQAKGFANGIMRTITRTSPEQWLEQLSPDEEIAALAFRTAHPEWIARSFAKVLPESELEAALAADSERPVVHLVARPGEISAEELALISGGEEGKYSPYAVYLESGDPGDLDAVRESLAGVQDEGSQLIARALANAPLQGPDKGRWLDLCAGPGGKAALLGALARIDGAKVDAVEISKHRAQLTLKAVSGQPVKVIVGDGRTATLSYGDGEYDRILVDAPCSGLGALRRRPEARWRKQESDIAELAQLQSELLTRALKLVRPGGVVIYSTCSPDLRETRQVVDGVLAKIGSQLGIKEVDAHALVEPMEDIGSDLSVQMWPHRHGTDAMFFAVLERS